MPRLGFVEQLERRLVPARPAARRRPLLLGAAASAALAAAAVLVGLAGGGLLSPDGTHEVRARDHCHFVSIRTRARTPVIVVNARGEPVIRYRTAVVRRKLKRCR